MWKFVRARREGPELEFDGWADVEAPALILNRNKANEETEIGAAVVFGSAQRLKWMIREGRPDSLREAWSNGDRLAGNLLRVRFWLFGVIQRAGNFSYLLKLHKLRD